VLGADGGHDQDHRGGDPGRDRVAGPTQQHDRFGAIGPILYGALIGAGHDPFRLFIGYLIGGGVMIIGGIVELLLGVPAQQQPLEAVARPLSAVAPLSKAAYSPGMLPSGTGTSAAVTGPGPEARPGLCRPE
jgi:hypothetical protein